MPRPPEQELAKAILAAAKLREESFDHASAAQLQSQGKSVNFETLYKLSMSDAARQASPVSLSYPVFLLLTNSWNEAMDWAKLHAI